MRSALMMAAALVVAGGCNKTKTEAAPAAPAAAPAAVAAPAPAAAPAAPAAVAAVAAPEAGKTEVAAAAAKKAFDRRPQPGEKAICPVMGEAFEVEADTQIVEHGGKFYAFCCPGCEPKFTAEPAKYAGK